MTKKISITPLGDRVVIKPFEKGSETKSPSGIIIPESVDKERSEQGEVIAVGPGKFDDGVQVPMQVKVGDTVLFSQYGPEEVKMNGEKYYIINETNILGIIK